MPADGPGSVSVNWTEIQPGPVKSSGFQLCSLNYISDNRLILHGGETLRRIIQNDTWILDLSTQKWMQYASDKYDKRSFHTGSTDLGNRIVIIGGSKGVYANYDAFATVYRGYGTKKFAAADHASNLHTQEFYSMEFPPTKTDCSS